MNHPRFFAAVLSLALLLGGCSAAETPAPEAPETPTSSQEAPQESAEPSAPEDPLSRPAGTAGTTDNPLIAMMMFSPQWDGQPVEMKSCAATPGVPCTQAVLEQQEGQPVLRLDFGQEAQPRMLELSFDGAVVEALEVTDSQGQLRYRQEDFFTGGETRSGSRLVWLGEGETSGLTLRFTLEDGVEPTGLGLASVEVTGQPDRQEDFAVAAYLPVNQAGDLSAYEETAAQVSDLILNTAVYWDAQGQLQVDPALETVLEQLGEAPQGQRRWVTINPQGELIRQGTAGQTLDTAEERQALAQTLLAFCQQQGLDGVDIDWEFPREEEWEDFSAFLVTLSQTLEPQGLGLSLALYPEAVPLSEEAVQAVDRVNLMAYDQFDDAGRHSTYRGAQEAVEVLTGMGFAPEQLLLGLPLYGRPLDGSAQWPALADAALPDDFCNEQDGVFYSNTALALDKTALAARQGLGGVMFYHLLCDTPGQEGQLWQVSQLARQVRGQA